MMRHDAQTFALIKLLIEHSMSVADLSSALVFAQVSGHMSGSTSRDAILESAEARAKALRKPRGAPQ